MLWYSRGFWSPCAHLFFLLMIPQIIAAAEVNSSATAQASDNNASSKVNYEDAAVIVHWQYVLVGVAGCFVLLLGTIIICLQLRRLRIEMERQETDAEMFGYRQYHAQQPHLATATESTLDLVSPVFVYSENEKSSSDARRSTDDETKNLATWFAHASEQTCTVCLEGFIDKRSSVRRLICGHLYHASCIDQWLTVRSCLCPMCKAPCFENIQDRSNQNDMNASDQEPASGCRSSAVLSSNPAQQGEMETQATSTAPTSSSRA
ncbi:hypothetical protein BCR43DRAFT_525740 [Syncephalastrum racemosum]|uniref:RING-type domain-containing protein n=1 Tax=Syncephalastrum racemosum TaxID=13706 RepID=A0A1X2H7L4_SYNRA|nr:hypothetical protein BCR43DRAFT_525740 [Syncephalastrum racemosum]